MFNFLFFIKFAFIAYATTSSAASRDAPEETTLTGDDVFHSLGASERNVPLMSTVSSIAQSTDVPTNTPSLMESNVRATGTSENPRYQAGTVAARYKRAPVPPVVTPCHEHNTTENTNSETTTGKTSNPTKVSTI